MDVEMKYGIAVVALIDLALLVRAMVLRSRLFRIIAFLREDAQEARESISSVWPRLLLLNRQGKIEVLHEWHFRSYEAGLEERLRHFIVKPGLYSRFVAWLHNDESEKVDIQKWWGWVERTERILWLGIFGLFSANNKVVVPTVLSARYLISLAMPWNGVKNLQISIAAWEQLRSDYRRLDEALTKYLKEAPEQSELRRRERAEKEEAERQKKLRQRLEHELAFLRSRTLALVRIHHRFWTNSVEGSLLLDPAEAISLWGKKLAELEKLELEPSDLVLSYRVLSSSFDRGRESKVEKDEEGEEKVVKIRTDPPVVFYAQKVVAQEAHLDRVIVNLQDLIDYFGHEPQRPLTLTRAERLLVRKVPALWYNMEWKSLDSVLKRVQRLLTGADNKIHQLRAHAQLIVPITKRVAWLKGMEKVLTDIHHIPVEPMEEWDQAQALFKRQIPTAWKSWDEKKLNELVAYARKIIGLRSTQLATRVGEKAEADKYKVGQPEEAVKKLHELQREILKGPEDQPIPTWQPEGSVVLTGDLMETEGGTLISSTLSDAWNGTDAKKKKPEPPVSRSRPKSTLDAIRQSEEQYARKGH